MGSLIRFLTKIVPNLTLMSSPASISSGFSGPQSTIARDSVTFERVAMRYGRGPEVLNDINFTLPEHSMSFLTGPSGAGKSSLLRLIYMQERPSRGIITLFGKDSAQIKSDGVPDIRRRIGLVLQDFSLIDHISVFENVALPLRVTGAKRASYREDVIELLEWVGLGDRMHAMPPTLSGGEKQRAAIARAVIAKPDILLADEPTGNVDPAMGARLIRLFTEMNRMGTTLLIATHDHALIPSGARVLSLSGGHIALKKAGG